MTIAITGANGFIGQYLCYYFSSKGIDTLAFCRRKLEGEFIQWIPYEMTRSIEVEVLSNVDVLIHLAYIPKSKAIPNSDILNFQACNQLVDAAIAAKVKKIIYFSSTSTHSEAESSYGKHKLAVEKMFNRENCMVFKPGLVLGEGGMIEKVGTMIKKLPIIPLIDGGRQPIQTIDIAQLADMLYLSIQKNLSGTLVACESNPVRMSDFYQSITTEMGVKKRFISLPLNPMYVLLYLLEIIGLTLPLSVENLLGLKKLKVFSSEEIQQKTGVKIHPMRHTISKYSAYIRSL